MDPDFKEHHSINGLPSIRLLRKNARITVVGKITPLTETPNLGGARTCAGALGCAGKVGLSR